MICNYFDACAAGYDCHYPQCMTPLDSGGAPTLNSGGAEGADRLFGELAHKAGHIVRHYSFGGHDTKCFSGIVILSDEQCREADPFLIQANKTLKRTFPSGSDYVNFLLRRNYWQIKDTKAVFAVAPLERTKRPSYYNTVVKGGTAWAVQMAIDMKINPIFLFDLNTNKWHKWHESSWISEGDFIIKPRFFNVYTGIGSRRLTTKGHLAIYGLYQ